MKKKLSLVVSLILAVGLMTGCSISTKSITPETASGLWDKVFVLPLATFITFLYNLLNQNLGLAIILATAIVRLVLMPLYLKSNKTSAIMQEIQPEMQQIQQKYENKTDQASQVKMQTEMMDLYKKYNFNRKHGKWHIISHYFHHHITRFILLRRRISHHTLIHQALRIN